MGAEIARTYGLISKTAVHRLTNADDRFISTDSGPTEIIGRGDADAIVRGSGGVTIRGEDGADVLIGGASANMLIGGQGADQTGLSSTEYFGFKSANGLNLSTSGTGNITLQFAPTRFVVFVGYVEHAVVVGDVDGLGSGKNTRELVRYCTRIRLCAVRTLLSSTSVKLDASFSVSDASEAAFHIIVAGGMDRLPRLITAVPTGGVQFVCNLR